MTQSVINCIYYLWRYMLMDKRPTVLLIYGGRGMESEVSLRGAENILPIIKENYDCLPTFIDKGGRWLCEGKELLLTQGGVIIDGIFTKIDCALPLLHGDFGEDGRVQGALDCASIPYVGCDSVCGAVCRDKFIVKAVASELGIPTLPCLLALKSDNREKAIDECERKIGYPLFVKPTSLGSSVGAGKANNKEELALALKEAFRVADRVIIERLLSPKRELECGFLSAKGKDLFTKCSEVLCQGFYDYKRKYFSPEVKTVAVADVGEDVNARIKDYSSRLVRALGIRDLSRIDFFLSGEELYFNEINTMPGMTETSLYGKMTEAEGISLRELIYSLIDGAISRA